MSATTDRPEWVQEGAPVVLYSTGGAGTPRNVKQSTIKRITATGFSVEAEHEPRFRFAQRHWEGFGFSVRKGGTWSSTRVVVPADRPEAKREIAEAHRARCYSAARSACEKWIRDPSAANRQAAIAALSATSD